MKLTKSKLKEIIREELLNEGMTLNKFQNKLGDFYLDIADMEEDLIMSGVDKKKIHKHIKEFLWNFKGWVK